jgi:aspartate racemase
MKKIIGIIGGMGPQATIDLFQKIVNLTPIKKEQEHLRIIIDNNPEIPDRTKAIFKKGKNPLPYFIKSARKLKEVGVDFIIIPCNTAHYFYNDLQKEIKIPVINMIEEVVNEIKRKFKYLPKKIGLLATSGTIKSRIYHKYFKKVGIKVITPDKFLQRKVMNLIYGKCGIKRSKMISKVVKDSFKKIIKVLIQKGVKAIIIGCTDISIVINPDEFSIPVIDSNLVLAKAAVKKALGLKRGNV